MQSTSSTEELLCRAWRLLDESRLYLADFRKACAEFSERKPILEHHLRLLRGQRAASRAGRSKRTNNNGPKRATRPSTLGAG